MAPTARNGERRASWRDVVQILSWSVTLAADKISVVVLSQELEKTSHRVLRELFDVAEQVMLCTVEFKSCSLTMSCFLHIQIWPTSV